jgi:hypothetical protein
VFERPTVFTHLYNSTRFKWWGGMLGDRGGRAMVDIHGGYT